MRGQRIRWATAGAAAAAAVIGGSAIAGARLLAGEGPEIHACAQQQTGQLRLSDDGTCRPSETAVSWNKQGPPGPQGDPGAASLDALAGTPCTLGSRTGVTYLVKADGLTRFDVYPQCLMADGSEPNDTRDAAVPLPTSSGPRFSTIFPAGDEDWFSIPWQALWSVGVYSQPGIAPADAPFTAELYRDGVLVKTATPSDPPGFWSLSWYRPAGDDGAPHDWLLHVTSPDAQLYLVMAS